MKKLKIAVYMFELLWTSVNNTHLTVWYGNFRRTGNIMHILVAQGLIAIK